MAAKSTLILALALCLALFASSAVAFISACDAATNDEEDYLCRRCEFLGRRGGCSSCEAMGPCKWMYIASEPASSACVARSIPDEDIAAFAFSASGLTGVRHAPGLCPADPTKAHRLEIEASTPAQLDGLKYFQEFFPKSYTNEDGDSFCAFPTEPYYVDTFAHSYVSQHFTDKEAKFPRMCHVVSKSFGLWTPVNGPTFYEEPRAFNKATLKTIVNTRCGLAGPPAKRDAELTGVGAPDPWASEMGRECIRAMQSAYCSVGCSEYGTAQGRLCPNQYRDYLYRICAPWTAGFSAYVANKQPLQNGCPLDPNNLPWDLVSDAFCDADVFHIQGSSRFEDVFGLNDEMVTKPQLN